VVRDERPQARQREADKEFRVYFRMIKKTQEALGVYGMGSTL
jgi:hypothetical protein